MPARRKVQVRTATVPTAVARQLANIYSAAGDPGSYGGVNRLFERARELGIGGKQLTRETVKRFLKGQQAYTLHKQVRRHYLRNRTYVARIDQQWQADLADVQKLAEHNDGYKYILTCIDVLSKYAWVVPVKSKNGKHMLAAMRELLRKAAPRKPTRLQTDKGKEFFNQHVSEFLRQRGIEHFASQSDQKAAIAERFNRTLKSRMWTYFTANKTDRYVNVLDDIVYAYNHSVHRSIGMRPVDVTDAESELLAWKRLYYQRDSIAKRNKANVKEGALVRVSRWKGDFAKGYVPGWSREHFRVKRIVSGTPRIVYKLKDAAGEPIEGTWYNEEVQPIARNIYEVEKVIGERQTPRIGAEVLVKWLGLPHKFNRWIPKRDLSRFQQPLTSQWQE